MVFQGATPNESWLKQAPREYIMKNVDPQVQWSFHMLKLTQTALTRLTQPVALLHLPRALPPSQCPSARVCHPTSHEEPTAEMVYARDST